MKKMVTNEQIQKIINAHESVLGTDNYNKYLMPLEWKYKKDNKWTGWKFIAWTVPARIKDTMIYFKTIKDRTYMMIECNTDEIERYEITPTVKELLGI